VGVWKETACREDTAGSMSILDSRHGVGGVLANGMRIAFGDRGGGIGVVEATSDSGMNITCFTDCH
jgi:hypothetical protein